MSETKVWSWGMKFVDGGLDLYKEPQLLNLKDKFLKQIHFGEKLCTRLDLTHVNTIVMLFKNKDHAELYQMGFCHRSMIGDDPEEYYEDILHFAKELDLERDGEDIDPTGVYLDDENNENDEDDK
jgi:hypothetical protein